MSNELEAPTVLETAAEVAVEEDEAGYYLFFKLILISAPDLASPSQSLFYARAYGTIASLRASLVNLLFPLPDAAVSE